MRHCNIPECTKRHYGRGYCQAHYSRLKRHGDPLGGNQTGYNEARAFLLENVLSYSGDECLIWPYARNEKGYAKVNMDGKMLRACRYICSVVSGSPETPDMEAAHSCGNGHLGCVTPKHLRWATHDENIADKQEHGTTGKKLTEDRVSDIRRMLAEGDNKHDIAVLFGITERTVRDIRKCRTWGWLPQDHASCMTTG